MIVAHVITCLDDGGAEAVLYRLCLADRQNRHVVVSLQDDGKYGALLKQAGIAVHCLDMPRGRVTPGGIWKLARLLRQLRPDVVQTWMYHADLLGGLVARVAGIRHVFWGLHHTNLEQGKTRRATILVARLNALLSRWIPERIVSCSQKGVAAHQAIGYAAKKFRVIPNGYDLRQFAPDPQAGAALRSTLPLPDGVPLLGMVARFDPQKDHPNLITALGLLKQGGHDFRCVLAGSGMTVANTGLVDWLDTHGIRDRILLLGQRSDIPAVMNALDVHVLSSAGEGFPNVLCEAMACGTPCVTTDAGDAGLIVGDTGWVVPVGSAASLADALTDAFGQRVADPAAWERRKAAARQRILDRFSIERMVDGYNRAWTEPC
ncbi:MAG: glycosyltransferase [Nitrosomonadales bacterium]|nr:glycosyltransferase [Nitrosomonadales bacterium]